MILPKNFSIYISTKRPLTVYLIKEHAAGLRSDVRVEPLIRDGSPNITYRRSKHAYIDL